MKHDLNSESILNNWCSEIDAKTLNDVRFRIFIEKESDAGFTSIYNTEFVEFGISDVDSSGLPKNFFLNEFD